MSASPAFDQRIRHLAERMTRFDDRTLDCRVIIESPHKHSAHGRRFVVRVEVSVPGRQVVICRTHNSDPSHEDPYVALRDAFRAARRKLLHTERSH
jgi:ribosome-associated translation inhibitor RaiA